MEQTDATTIGQIVLGLVTIIGLLAKEWRDDRERKHLAQKVGATLERTRADLEARAARLALDTDAHTRLLADALATGNADLTDKIDASTAVARQAAEAAVVAQREANSFNQKWTALRDAELARVDNTGALSGIEAKIDEANERAINAAELAAANARGANTAADTAAKEASRGNVIGEDTNERVRRLEEAGNE